MGLKSWFKRTFLPKPPPPEPGTARFDPDVINEYRNAGIAIGDAVSYIYMGECIGFDKLLDKWETTERQFSELGYRTISLDDFVSAGGYGKDLPELAPRNVGEEPVFHAAYYREHFFQKIGPAINFDEMMKTGEAQCATYAVPSTKHLNKE